MKKKTIASERKQQELKAGTPLQPPWVGQKSKAVLVEREIIYPEHSVKRTIRPSDEEN